MYSPHLVWHVCSGTEACSPGGIEAKVGMFIEATMDTIARMLRSTASLMLSPVARILVRVKG